MADLVDEDWLLNDRAKPMSSSIAGLYAIASKPGQSLAPMLGWFVLRSAGYDPAAGQGDKQLHDPAAAEPAAAGAAGLGGAGGGAAAEYVPPPAAVTDALLALLVWLPAAVAVVQVRPPACPPAPLQPPARSRRSACGRYHPGANLCRGLICAAKIGLWVVYQLHGAELKQLKVRAKERDQGSIL